MLLLACAVLLHACGGSVRVAQEWIPVPASLKAESDVFPENETISFGSDSSRALAPISTGPVAGGNTSMGIARLPWPSGPGPSGLTSEVRFVLDDTVPGAKTRLEATTCFATNSTLAAHGVAPGSPQQQILSQLRWISQNCSVYTAPEGAEAGGSQRVRYGVRFPRTLSSSGQFIAGQFHGRPDPRIFFNPQTNSTRRLSTAQAFAACNGSSGWRCQDGAVSSGPLGGWQYKQGGYPPLTFGLFNGTWAVVGRSDDRLFIPKADCGFNPGHDSTWPTRPCPGGAHEQVHGMWRSASFSDMPLGEWLTFEWRVVWSGYARDGGALVRNGSVAVTAVSERTGAAVFNVTWAGPLGRHDDGRTPYFKMGIYNPSGSTAELQTTFKDLIYSTGPAAAGVDAGNGAGAGDDAGADSHL